MRLSCLITDLSYPPGQSVNDGINPDLWSLTYTTVDDITRRIAIIGPGEDRHRIRVEAGTGVGV